MTMMQYLSTFRLYNAEVLLLALGVTLLTTLLKRTLLKNMTSRVYVFLPFALGLVVYAVFRTIVTMSPTPLTAELGATIEGGFATGCAATLYYVVWEQFFRVRHTETPVVYPMLSGFVEEEMRLSVAREICEKGATADRDTLYAFVQEELRRYAAAGVTEEERIFLSALIVEFLLAGRSPSQNASSSDESDDFGE